MVSRKPWTAGPKARRRIRSVLTRLMPILTLIRSAGVSRMARAVNGSSRALPPKPEVDQLHAAEGGGERGPGGGGARGVGAVADRTAVVQPDPAAPVARHGLDRGVGAQGDELGGLVVRQPDLDVLQPSGRPVKRRVPTGPGRDLGDAGGHVDGQGVAARSRRPGRPVGRRRAGRTRRPAGAGRPRRPAWWAACPARRRSPGSGRPAVRRRAGPRHGQLAGRCTGRGPGRAAGAAARRAAVCSRSRAPRRRSAVMGVVTSGWVRGVAHGDRVAAVGRARVHGRRFGRSGLGRSARVRARASCAAGRRGRRGPGSRSPAVSGALWLNPPPDSRLT